MADEKIESPDVIGTAVDTAVPTPETFETAVGNVLEDLAKQLIETANVLIDHKDWLEDLDGRLRVVEAKLASNIRLS